MRIATILPILSIFTGLAVATSGFAQQTATVDMNKIFSAYYKTKDAETKINEARSTAKAELDERMESYKKNLEAINKLNEDLQKPELSKDAKDQKAKARDEKIGETKSLEREINEFRGTREKQLQEQAVRMRNGIVEEISKVIQDLVKTKGYSIVFDKSGSSLNGVPILVYSKEDLDFSAEVVEVLNRNKPKTAATPAPAPTKKP